MRIWQEKSEKIEWQNNQKMKKEEKCHLNCLEYFSTFLIESRHTSIPNIWKINSIKFFKIFKIDFRAFEAEGNKDPPKRENNKI